MNSMKFITPTILIIVAIALFFMYIDPAYERVSTLRAEQATFDQALDRSKELMQLRDNLLSTYNSFSSSDLDRLKKLLPDHVDSVRLIIDIDNIAARHGLRVQEVDIGSIDDKRDGEIGVVDLTFSVDAPYETLKQFLMDLEDSLRVIDITSLAFSVQNSALSRYNISIQTYWLR